MENEDSLSLRTITGPYPALEEYVHTLTQEIFQIHLMIYIFRAV